MRNTWGIRFVYAMARCSSHIFLKLWTRFETTGGAEYVPASGPCIIVANHASYIDPPAIASGVSHRIVHYMARDTLMPNRFAKWFFLHCGILPIDRTRGDVSALKSGIKLLKDGGVLGLFPEGTRTLDGKIQPPKGGVGFLIAKAGVPVVPVYIGGSFEAWKKGTRFIKRKKVSVTFGKPIPPEVFEALGKGRDSYQKAGELVMQRITMMRDERENAARSVK